MTFQQVPFVARGELSWGGQRRETGKEEGARTHTRGTSGRTRERQQGSGHVLGPHGSAHSLPGGKLKEASGTKHDTPTVVLPRHKGDRILRFLSQGILFSHTHTPETSQPG